jgi:hypothetical protein
MEPVGDCIEYTLGQAAIDFIKKERLAVGHTLANLLLDTLDLDSGRVSVFFPAGLSVDELEHDFEGGDRLPFPPESEWIHYVQDDGLKMVMAPIPKAESDLIEIALAHVRASEGHLCILENPLASRGDPWISRAKTRVLFFLDEVYHLAQGTSVGERGIREALTEAETAWETIGALTSLPPEKAISARQRKLTLEQVKLMAERTVKLFTVAYDGEGYLIWHRDASPMPR